MTGKLGKYTPAPGVEIGSRGKMNDVALERHRDVVRQGQIAQAKANSKGHPKGHRCGACLWLEEVGEKGA